MSKTWSVGKTLSYKDLQEVARLEMSKEPVRLIAPNKQIQALWQKEYPHIEVLLAGRVPTPTKSNKEERI